ncbi:50S ribosomal protein L17 [bacterium]|jgi:large subunit ribosomal protein L17|nr:50S ribosomal protein L17 [bacterium]MDG2006202.1 50S ribosomal protein L17 [Thermodesulfobacteriota bacterium]
MRHRVRKGKLGLKTEHRLSVLRNLCTELFRHGRITSTDVKIKELKRFSEKIITTAKTDSVHSRRLVNTKIKDKDILKKLFEEIAPSFSERPGGYTRIVKLNFRRGDAAPISLIELVGMQVPFQDKSKIDSPELVDEKVVDSKKVE